jgi:hypothetical protein
MDSNGHMVWKSRIQWSLARAPAGWVRAKQALLSQRGDTTAASLAGSDHIGLHVRALGSLELVGGWPGGQLTQLPYSQRLGGASVACCAD